MAHRFGRRSADSTCPLNPGSHPLKDSPTAHASGPSHGKAAHHNASTANGMTTIGPKDSLHTPPGN
ncbi:hypothetical protein HPP92_012097 [Vanilla planifolia]|uniref:Uncharacterized protein n=1 Tax=Vanilla planifolia TaxID=51239 RepID=A0A835UZ31_VANPL|nr:hypothetical protein HPP92_012097 [Vanilla planifolia]